MARLHHAAKLRGCPHADEAALEPDRFLLPPHANGAEGARGESRLPTAKGSGAAAATTCRSSAESLPGTPWIGRPKPDRPLLPPHANGAACSGGETRLHAVDSGEI